MTDRQFLKVSIESLGAGVAAQVADYWSEASLFLPVDPDHEVVSEIEACRLLAEESGLDRHPFFNAAKEDPDLLRLWVSQEAVVTGPFSLLLMRVAGAIWNVHLRAMFLELAVGEHGRRNGDRVVGAHPVLLHRLLLSVGLSVDQTRPIEPTINFLRDLEDASTSVASAIGALGVGNERLLLVEYEAVKAAFASRLPDAAYRSFLTANIAEDDEHSVLAEQVAARLVELGATVEEYRRGAEFGVAARLRYYDELCAYYEQHGLPSAWMADSQTD